MGMIYDSFYRNVNSFKENIDSIIGQLDMSGSSLYKSIEALQANLKTMRSIYKSEFSDIKFNDETNVIHNISDDLQYFVNNAINPFDQEMLTKFNNLNLSIDTVYNTISKQKNSIKEFKANTNELANYIKVINTVQLNKLKPLTTLVVELNKLANKLGGLDKLTTALTDELAIVLKDLVNALTESKETISEAHRLQSNRHDQITKAIGTIKGLLNMPLNVNIQATGNSFDDFSGADPADPSSSNNGGQSGSTGNFGNNSGSTDGSGGSRGSQTPSNPNRDSSRYGTNKNT